MDYSPIILFTYNRPEHTRITLEYLAKCKLASESILYVFCDGPKIDSSPNNLEKINRVYEVLKTQSWPKQIFIEKSITNKGLFNNVTDGVSKVIEKHGRCIVLEDDLKIGKYFLEYMNLALDKYENVNQVKQISGFVFPINFKPDSNSVFLPLSNTIGWGTWKRAWNEVDLNAAGYNELFNNKDLAYKFNLNGTYNYTKMIKKQMENNLYGSWGVIYWWSVFKANGIVLYPHYSLIQHNDFDHSGQHASDDSHYNYKDWDENARVYIFPTLAEFNNKEFYNNILNHLKRRTNFSLKNIFIKLKSIIQF